MVDNIKLADGTLISTADGKRTISTEINNAFSDESRKQQKASDSFVMGKRRFLDDLPMPFLQSRPVAIIAAYTVFGLAAGDISRILNIPVYEVARIRDSNDYAIFMDGLLQNIREFDSNHVRKKLNDSARKAAEVLVEMAEGKGGDPRTKLKAATEILDRTGNRPNDIVEHRHIHEGGITIRVIEDEDRRPTIDLEVNDA